MSADNVPPGAGSGDDRIHQGAEGASPLARMPIVQAGELELTGGQPTPQRSIAHHAAARHYEN